MKELSAEQVIARQFARNYLDEPAPASKLVQVVSDVCGIQAQMMPAAELDLSARVANITQAELRDALWQKRTLVKTYGPRGTLHLLPANELPLWMAAQRAAEQRNPIPWYAALSVKPKQAEELVDAIGEAVDGKCLTREELADAVARRVGEWAREGIASAWADRASGEAAFRGQLCFGPPQGSRVTFVRADQWIPHWHALDPEKSLLEILRRYLKTYGPATLDNFAQWFWLKPADARVLFETLGDELAQVEVAGKRAWLLANDKKRTSSEKHSVRLVPQYDCYILGSRLLRDLIIPAAARKRIATYGRGPYEGAVGVPVLLIDGIVAGMWERRTRAKRIEIKVQVSECVTVALERALQSEAERIGKFFGTEAAFTIGALN